MNKKGFTLAELLGVIILLAAISASIAVPILSQINKTTTKVNKAIENILYTSAGLYMDRYSGTYKKVNENIYYITIEQLMNSGLLEDDFLSKNSSSSLTKETQIKVTIRNKSYHYEIPDTMLDSILEKYSKISTSTYNYVDGTYIKGDYGNNYVLYNGFMWRIMGKNKDNTIRLVMDENATSIIYFDNIDYKNSFVRNWLNDYFISRLQFNDIIAKEKWYYKANSSISNTTPNIDSYVEDKVGLVSLEEFNLSFKDSSSYINKKCTGLLNQSDDVFYSTCDTNNMPKLSSNEVPLAVKPVINVYSSIIVSDGNGSKDNPYILGEYKTSKINETLESANVSVGSYIKMYNNNYRVIEKEPDGIKLMSYSVTSNSSNYASTGYTFNLNNGIGEHLNSFFKYDKYLKTNIFLGKIYGLGDNYKSTVFAKVNIIYDTFSSLPVLGELLTSNLYSFSDNICYWTINMSDVNRAYKICTDGSVITNNVSSYNSSTSNLYRIIHTAYISLDNVITSGNGTPSNPFVLQE